MRLTALCWLLLLSLPALAQVGGISAYEFLNLPQSAGLTALGGHQIAVIDDDVTLAARNPALLNPEMDGAVSLSHAFLPGGINHSFLSYARHEADLATTFAAGLQYVGYGDLVRRDPTGQNLGTFQASDYALTLGAARTFEDRLSVGAAAKVVASQLAGYSSVGVAFDAAVHYRDTTGRFGITLLARNFGRQLTRFSDAAGREPMPFELQVGLSRELKYLPFRFSVTYRYLDRWNVLYDDPDAVDDFQIIGVEGTVDQERGPGAIFFDNLARHFVFGGELLLGRQRNFRLRVGYNHGLRRELRLSDFRSAAGYSFGFGWYTRRFNLAYGRGTYHLGGGVNHLTIGTRLH